jgi:hypothetical protein
VVGLIRFDGHSRSGVLPQEDVHHAKDFDLTETAVRLWVSQAEVDAGERDGLTSSEREELAALRRENRCLREDIDILKRATAFFASAVSGCPAWVVSGSGVMSWPRRRW